MNLYRHLINIKLSKKFHTSSVVLKISEDAVVSKKELVPSKPVPSRINRKLLPPKTYINDETIALLERLSLINCATKAGIKVLEDAIEFADQIHQVNTDGVQPLLSVLEDRPLETREDKVTEGNCKKDILSNATVKEDDYFVAPPGNIPIASRNDILLKKKPMK